MIHKLRILFWLGIGMIFLSFIGIPNTVKMCIAIGIGSTILFLAFRMRHDYQVMKNTLKQYGQ